MQQKIVEAMGMISSFVIDVHVNPDRKNIYFSSSRRGNQGDEKLVNILDPLLKDLRSRRQDFPLTIIYGTWRPWRIVFLTLVVNLEMNNMNQ